MKLFVPRWLIAVLLTAAGGILIYLSIPTRPESQFRAGVQHASSAIANAYLDFRMMEADSEGNLTEMDSGLIRSHLEKTLGLKLMKFLHEEFTFAIVEEPSPNLARLENQVIATLSGRDKVVLFYGDGRITVFHEPGAIKY